VRQLGNPVERKQNASNLMGSHYGKQVITEGKQSQAS